MGSSSTVISTVTSTLTTGTGALWNKLCQAGRLCTDSKISNIFRTTITSIQGHPYIATAVTFGAVIGLYYNRENISTLAHTVGSKANDLYQYVKQSFSNLLSSSSQSSISQKGNTETA